MTSPYDPCPCGSGKKYKFCCAQNNRGVQLGVGAPATTMANAMALGLQHFQAGQLGSAENIFKQVLATQPQHTEALHYLGLIAHQYGRYDVAMDWIRRSLSNAPQFAEGYGNLAVVQIAAKRMDDALLSLSQAIDIRPNYPEALSNLGVVYLALGRHEEAVASCERAVAARPEFAQAHNNLGAAHLAQGQLAQALPCIEHAVALQPDNAEFVAALGGCLYALGHLARAAGVLAQANSLRPGNANVNDLLGSVALAEGRFDAAVLHYSDALGIEPDSPNIHSNLVFAAQFVPGLSSNSIFQAHQAFGLQLESRLKPNWPRHCRPEPRASRIRVGYVSADFRDHAVAYFFEPIMRHHNKVQFEVFCYHNQARHDAQTDAIAAHADHWLPCFRLSDDELAARIVADGIDILVDLSGHTAGNRLSVFARKPAPVQATWIGYAGSTGLTAMDYRITDAYMDPPGLTECWHTEQLVRLPGVNAAYEPVAGCPEVNTLPALGGHGVVFGALNNLSKVNQPVVALWARVLKAVPGSRIMLGNVTDEGVRARMEAMFALEGIGAEHLILKPKLSILEYLALHHEIDVALDTFPYNGGTTSMHALWMGVPVITLAGDRPMSRVGVSVLAKAGLEQQWVANTPDEYVQLAQSQVQDLPALNALRQDLRARMQAGQTDAATITRHLETAYHTMWQNWCVSSPTAAT